MPHVLVVDDDDGIRESLEDLLGWEGYEVTIARHRPDVIVSDIRMPPPDGIRLLELLATQGVHIPAILITTQPVTRPHIADALLHKPFGVDQLVETITHVCGGAPTAAC